MQRQVPKIENLRRLMALEVPEAPWVRGALTASEPPPTQALQGEFIEMAEKLGIQIPPEEPMVELPLCLLRAIVNRLI